MNTPTDAPKRQLPSQNLKDVGRFVAHMAEHMCDKALKADFADCVLPAAPPAIRDRLWVYYRARRCAPRFMRDQLHNNHRYIEAKTLQAILGDRDERPTVICRVCHSEFTPRRKDAQVCSARCRQQEARNRRVSSQISDAE